MIKLMQQGEYEIIETKKMTKILSLSNETKVMFAWINANDIGEILIKTNKTHPVNSVIANGNYRLYEVRNEDKYTDLPHLELYVGNGKWQGYLLPTGLPTDNNPSNKIIATREIITKSTI